ncbi:VanZ family protein [Rhodococcus triatomae]|uniref:VanZ like family protein n=1 Tax=Rhodococcus triatomae TaxID=300028 RepID=A0A1G8FFF2_9NOCA|nr:hypothetical protein [Rhodococcus triatomae]QNG19470.1 VanZ family protein [Rhodococcus triatomae]QNG24615.1 VanZ family protein [Rhodococcus triatomae]SDH80881.1 hypothetical protein SAMN05444695_103269 [Rhodococcus triatomae]
MIARRVPVAILTAIALVMLLSPASATPSGPEHSDKLVHALLFAALAAASLYARFGPSVTAGWLVAFAAGTELAQAALPLGRHGSVWDFVADVAGVAAVLAGHAVIRRSRSAV